MNFADTFEIGKRFRHEPTGKTGVATGRQVNKPNPPSPFAILMIQLQMDDGEATHFPAEELKPVK